MGNRTAVVTGAGIGGLAAAVRLAAKGYRVRVFDKSKATGGKLSELRHKGFRFDRGPSLLTLPHLVDELFTLCGEDPRDHFKYKRLELSCKYFWEDGTNITAWQDKDRFTDEVMAKCGIKPALLERFFKKSKDLYDLTAESFLLNSLHKPSNFLSPSFLKTMLNSYRLDAFVTMHTRNKSWFNDNKLVQLFDRYATYNGSSPYKTPATLNIIAHLEHTEGTWFPEKGIFDIAASITSLAEKMGVEFYLENEVREIVHSDFRVKGIKTDDMFVPAGIVVNNTDVNLFYTDLFKGSKMPRRLVSNERSTSALIFYWGVNRDEPRLQLHNILFSENYREEFRHLFTYRTIFEDPTVYIYISSRAVTSDAPEGSENWYVMINAPENSGQDWEEMIPEARRNIIAKINRMLGIDIEKFITFESIASPVTIEKETGSWNGSLYGISSNSMFAAFNRQPNFRRRYENLFFTGGSVHPGGGMPLCLASAKIIDREIKVCT
ncbi:MAG: phytoene desaturase [Marinilabiliales bacterium]|nr:MAG: phytoene desaturase [Marinilabiliales bacterium]